MTKHDVNIENSKGFIVGDHGTVIVNLPSPVTQSTVSRDELLRRVSAVNAELRGYPHDISGIQLERPEVEEIVVWALQGEGSLGMVLDHAGGGKTVILRSALLRLEE